MSKIDKESANNEPNRQNTIEMLNNKTKIMKKKKKKSKKKEEIVSDKQQFICVEYLNQWKNEKSNWKFSKVKQIRLVSHIFDKDKIPDESFTILIEYISGGSESLKKIVKSKANEVIAEMENWQSLSEEEKLTTHKVDGSKYSRARCLLQDLE